MGQHPIFLTVYGLKASAANPRRPCSDASGLSGMALRKLWKGAQLWVWAQKPGVRPGPIGADGPWRRGLIGPQHCLPGQVMKRGQEPPRGAADAVSAEPPGTGTEGPGSLGRDPDAKCRLGAVKGRIPAPPCPSLVSAWVSSPNLSEGGSLAAAPLRVSRWRVKPWNFTASLVPVEAAPGMRLSCSSLFNSEVFGPQETVKHRTCYEMRDAAETCWEREQRMFVAGSKSPSRNLAPHILKEGRLTSNTHWEVTISHHPAGSSALLPLPRCQFWRRTDLTRAGARGCRVALGSVPRQGLRPASRKPGSFFNELIPGPAPRL